LELAVVVRQWGKSAKGSGNAESIGYEAVEKGPFEICSNVRCIRSADASFEQLPPTPVTLLTVRGQTVWVKREDLQPTGTHKHRKGVLAVAEAVRDGTNVLAMITEGNTGVAAAFCAQGTAIQVRTLVRRGIAPGIIAALRDAGASVQETDLHLRFTEEEVIARVRTNPDERIRDVTNGFEHAYRDLVRELLELRPDEVVCPVGGELYMGVHQALRESGSSAALTGVTVRNMESIADKLPDVFSVYRSRIETLCAGDPTRRLLTLDEEEVHEAMRLVPEGMRAEPSAAVVFQTMHRLVEPGKRLILINTGYGVTG
jgi:threonine dehydratase